MCIWNNSKRTMWTWNNSKRAMWTQMTQDEQCELEMTQNEQCELEMTLDRYALQLLKYGSTYSQMHPNEQHWKLTQS